MLDGLRSEDRILLPRKQEPLIPIGLVITVAFALVGFVAFALSMLYFQTL